MIPVPISDGHVTDVLPQRNLEIVKELDYFIVENIRTARRFLKKMDPSADISSKTFYELNEHTPENEINGYLQPLRVGKAVGVMSEAGCPGVADPGASVVALAQAEGFKIVPLVGPSSILLALMASGLNGQRFSFRGYLPVDNSEREKSIKNLETESRKNDMTQIFIETPYRNMKMMESLVKNLQRDTLLCVASHITSPDESIITKRVEEWKAQGFTLAKVPTIFLFYAGHGNARRR